MFNSHGNVVNTKWLPGWNRSLNPPASRIECVHSTDSTPSWKLKTYQHVWIKKRQFKYDDQSQFDLGNWMDKRDNIDWINTITRRIKLYIWIH